MWNQIVDDRAHIIFRAFGLGAALEKDPDVVVMVEQNFGEGFLKIAAEDRMVTKTGVTLVWNFAARDGNDHGGTFDIIVRDHGRDRLLLQRRLPDFAPMHATGVLETVVLKRTAGPLREPYVHRSYGSAETDKRVASIAAQIVPLVKEFLPESERPMRLTVKPWQPPPGPPPAYSLDDLRAEPDPGPRWLETMMDKAAEAATAWLRRGPQPPSIVSWLYGPPKSPSP
jgi:hypothetical protein